MKRLTRSLGALITIALFAMPTIGAAATAAEIDASVDKALGVFAEDIDGSEVFLGQAAGYLVFPRVLKVGIGIGGETGEGALRIDGKTAGYYRTSAGSFGFQLGAQAKAIVIAFMTQNALDKFLNSSGWKIGGDASVAVVDIGAGKTIDSQNIKDPVVGFIFDSKGLMYNLTLEGSKISKIDR